MPKNGDTRVDGDLLWTWQEATNKLPGHWLHGSGSKTIRVLPPHYRSENWTVIDRCGPLHLGGPNAERDAFMAAASHARRELMAV